MKIIEISWIVQISHFMLLLSTCSSLAAPLQKLPPHAGYHGASAQPGKPFFEGWYLRVITKDQGSFSLIYHIFDPHADTARQGVGLQIMTPDSTFVMAGSDVSKFQADPHRLSISNEFQDGKSFFGLTDRVATGRLIPDKGNDGTEYVDFDFRFVPEIGWGGGGDTKQFSTAGFLAAFPIFEPHYQVLISRANVEGGHLSVVSKKPKGSTRYDLKDATVYLEKNWGGSFPSAWWWIQASTFDDSDGNPVDLCVTSTGGRRRLPLLADEEEVALVCLHWKGEFLPFPMVEWEVQWGSWQIEGSYQDYSVQLTGTCGDSGKPVLCPTVNGMEEIAFENFCGKLRVELYKNGQKVLDEISNDACLEVGGRMWKNQRKWKGESVMTEPIKTIAMNEDAERVGSEVVNFMNKFVEIPGL